MSNKPTLVFVPGAWHGPECWEKLIALTDLKSIAVTLPTTLGDVTKNFSDDVKAIRDVIVAETAEGKDVVVVVHSYGGACGASALKGLTEKSESSLPTSTDKKPGRVIGLFMIATGFAVRDTTFLGGFGDEPPPIWSMNYETGFVDLTVDPRELFYHDLSEEDGKYWVGKLKPQSLRALNEGAEDSYDGWREVSCWFLATTQDHALPIEAQRFFVETAKASGGDITLREIDSSHSPFLSKAEETARVLHEAIAAFTR